jgi:hypothetical protein
MSACFVSAPCAGVVAGITGLGTAAFKLDDDALTLYEREHPYPPDSMAAPVIGIGTMAPIANPAPKAKAAAAPVPVAPDPVPPHVDLMPTIAALPAVTPVSAVAAPAPAGRKVPWGLGAIGAIGAGLLTWLTVRRSK